MEFLSEIVKQVSENKAAIIAFVFSCASLILSMRTTFLDRARLVVKSRGYIYDNGSGKLYNQLEITIFNYGRRDAAINEIEYRYNNGVTVSKLKNDDALILKENQKKVINLDSFDLGFSGPEGDFYILEDIVIIDVRGKVIEVPDVKEHIKKVHLTFDGE